MGRRHWHPSSCRSCGVTVEEVGHISAMGNCPQCALDKQVAAMVQQIEHRGPVFERWREKMAACVGAKLPAPEPAAESEAA